MTGTEAVHSDDPMTPEAAQELSSQILGEMGLGQPKDQAEGADHAGQSPVEANPYGEPDEGPAAAGNLSEADLQGAEAGGQPAPEMNAAWVAALPEEVRADLSRFNPQTVAKLREIAESGLRLDDYTRKTQKTAANQREIEILRKKAEFADEVLQNKRLMAEFYRDDPQAAPAEGEQEMDVEQLMSITDPKQFAAGLDKLINDRINSGVKQQKQNSPEYKAARVRHAADQIHEAIKDKLPDGTWERACQLFEEHCAASGVQWYEVDVSRLAMDMRPHIRFAVAEHVAQGQQPRAAGVESGTSTQVPSPGVRAAAIRSSGPNTPTQSVPRHVREGRPISDEEAFKNTMRKYGIGSDADLTRLRLLDQ